MAAANCVRKLSMGEQAAENVDGIVAAHERLGKIHPRIPAGLRHGNAVPDGLGISVSRLHSWVVLERQFHGLLQAQLLRWWRGLRARNP
jgi:hypothetical protein